MAQFDVSKAFRGSTFRTDVERTAWTKKRQEAALEPELPKITAPTLLLWGKQDRVLDVSSIEVMKPLLQKPSVAIMNEVGHAPMLERPEQSALLYRQFLQSAQ